MRGIKENVLLAPHTSWLVGGPAEFFAEPVDVDEIRSLIVWAAQHRHKVTVLGGGSNVLVSDAGIKGLVISLNYFKKISVISESPNLVFTALSGTPKSELLRIFLKYKLHPALFLAGLPGQLGGGVVMNAGVSEKIQPREFNEIVESVTVLNPDGSLRTFNKSELTWSYRHCHGWEPGIIIDVKFSWPNVPDDSIPGRVRELNHLRLSKQPLDLPSCGSVFRNPLPEHAGVLIENAGLKGTQIGGAEISKKHANFIVNIGNAKSADIKALIELAQKTVKEKFQIDLQTEVVFLD